MAKTISNATFLVSLPTGWDKKLIMTSEDFALLSDLFARSVRVREEYALDQYHLIEDPMTLTASIMLEPRQVLTAKGFSEWRKGEEDRAMAVSQAEFAQEPQS